MKTSTEKIENQMEVLPYEQPILKKYGSMYQLTKSTAGSGGDGVSHNTRFETVDPDE